MVQVAIDPAQNAAATISAIVQRQRTCFNTGKTKPVEFRLAQLQALKQAITSPKF